VITRTVALLRAAGEGWRQVALRGGGLTAWTALGIASAISLGVAADQPAGQPGGPEGIRPQAGVAAAAPAPGPGESHDPFLRATQLAALPALSEPAGAPASPAGYQPFGRATQLAQALPNLLNPAEPEEREEDEVQAYPDEAAPEEEIPGAPQEEDAATEQTPPGPNPGIVPEDETDLGVDEEDIYADPDGAVTVLERPRPELEPLGVRLGSFVLYPKLAIDEVYTHPEPAPGIRLGPPFPPLLRRRGRRPACQGRGRGFRRLPCRHLRPARHHDRKLRPRRCHLPARA
jgi:hypothetical protein